MQDKTIQIPPSNVLGPAVADFITADRGTTELVPVIFALNTDVYEEFQALWHSWQLHDIPAESDDSCAAELLQDAIDIGMRSLRDEMFSYPLKPELCTNRKDNTNDPYN